LTSPLFECGVELRVILREPKFLKQGYVFLRDSYDASRTTRFGTILSDKQQQCGQMILRDEFFFREQSKACVIERVIEPDNTPVIEFLIRKNLLDKTEIVLRAR